MKITKKRGKRGKERKALCTQISPRAYLKLCKIAGERSFREALEEMLLKDEEKGCAAK